MAQLIQMRQQIRAIESIKKITHAMRLISMSGHSQLSHRVPLIENYKNELFKIINIVQSVNKSLKSNILNPSEIETKKLIILIGSQKGLAGTFNTSLFKFFERQIQQQDFQDYKFITVGKKATDFIKKHVQPIEHYDQFTILNLNQIADKIYNHLMSQKAPYSDVIVYYNYPKSFFAQIPQKYILIPSAPINNKDIDDLELENYIWEQSSQDIYEDLLKEFLLLSIQSTLFNSLLAEQAARFQSMDSATRNAEELLTTLKLQYNKLRQSKITKEITELSTTLI